MGQFATQTLSGDCRRAADRRWIRPGGRAGRASTRRRSSTPNWCMSRSSTLGSSTGGCSPITGRRSRAGRPPRRRRPRSARSSRRMADSSRSTLRRRQLRRRGGHGTVGRERDREVAGRRFAGGRGVGRAGSGSGSSTCRRRPVLRAAGGASAPILGINRLPGTAEDCGVAGFSPTDQPRQNTVCTGANDLVSFTPQFGAALPPAPSSAAALQAVVDPARRAALVWNSRRHAPAWGSGRAGDRHRLGLARVPRAGRRPAVGARAAPDLGRPAVCASAGHDGDQRLADAAAERQDRHRRGRRGRVRSSGSERLHLQRLSPRPDHDRSGRPGPDPAGDRRRDRGC